MALNGQVGHSTYFSFIRRKIPLISKKIMQIADMSSPLDPSIIEARKRAIEASYQRQIELAGKPGYDPQLTLQLKKDMDWLVEQEAKKDVADSQ
jgi:hypothetical protein